MNDRDDKPTEAMESLLRRWGADQAAREALVPPAPVATRPKRSRLAATVYWLSTAAAAGILLAVGLMWFAPGLLHKVRSTGELGAPKEGGSAAELRRQLARRRSALASTSSELTEIRKKLSVAVTRAESAQAEIAFLRRTQEARKSNIEQMQAKVDIAEQARKDAEARARTAAAEVKTVQAKLAAATADRDKVRDDLKAWPARLAAAAAEASRVRKMHDDAMAANKKAQEQLVALRAARKAMLADLQRAYLALGPNEPDSLAVRQAAAERAKMLPRLAGVCSTVQDEPKRRLIDSLEVVFTRLSMLNANDAEAAGTFVRLVKGGGLAERIDEALAAGVASAEARMWLLEANMILAGVDRVG